MILTRIYEIFNYDMPEDIGPIFWDRPAPIWERDQYFRKVDADRNHVFQTNQKALKRARKKINYKRKKKGKL